MRERKKKITGEFRGILQGFQRNIPRIMLMSFSSANEGMPDWQHQNLMVLLKRNNMRRSSKNSLFQKPVNSCEGKATDWVSPPLSCPFSSGMACCTGTLRWPRQQLLRGYQGCDIEKQFVCREGNLGWISAIYNTALSLLIMFNMWHIIVTYYMQYIARVSLTSLWNVGRVSGQWGLWGEGSYQLANPALPHSLQQLVMDC